YRLGRFAVRRRWRVLAAWIVVVVALGVIGNAAGGGFHDEFKIPGTEAQRATDLLKATFNEPAGTSAQGVVHATSGTRRDPRPPPAVADAIDNISALPHVVSAPNPLDAGGAISPDSTIALAQVQYENTGTDPGKAEFEALQHATEVASNAGVQVEFG